MSYTSLLQDTATHWSTPTKDRYAQLSFGSKSSILCRWEDKQVLSTDAKGEEFVSSAIVYTSTKLELNEFLFLGTSAEANPQDETGAYKIKSVGKIGSPSGSIVVYKNILGK